MKLRLLHVWMICSLSPWLQANDRFYALLLDNDASQTRVVQVDTDGASNASMTILHSISTSVGDRGGAGAPEGLAFSAGLGASGSLIWLEFEPDLTYADTHTYLRTMRLDLSSGSVSPLSEVMAIEGRLAASAGAWNPYENLFEGVGYYVGFSFGSSQLAYFGSTASGLVSTQAFEPEYAGFSPYLSLLDFEFDTTGIHGTAAFDRFSDGISGCFHFDTAGNLSEISAFTHLMVSAQGAVYSIQAPMQELGSESSGGLMLYQVDPTNNSATLVTNLEESGNYQVLDLASASPLITTAPEPSSAFFILSSAILAFMRRRR